MPILYAELQVLGRQVPCTRVQFAFRQAIDQWGRPSSVVRIERLQVTLTGEAVGWGIWEELKFAEYRRVSGWVLGFDGEGQTAKRYAFYDAALVELKLHHDGRGPAGQPAATSIELHFAPAAVDVDGVHYEAYSVIPWETDPQTSLRALTKPADPLPSAHLAALRGPHPEKEANSHAPSLPNKAPTGAYNLSSVVATDGYRTVALGFAANTRTLGDAPLTEVGIDKVLQHLSRTLFLTENGQMAANNTIMINRLKEAIAGHRLFEIIDQYFYTHELREAELMDEKSMSYDQAHAVACKEYGVTADMEKNNIFYTQEALNAWEQQQRTSLGF